MCECYVFVMSYWCLGVSNYVKYSMKNLKMINSSNLETEGPAHSKKIITQQDNENKFRTTDKNNKQIKTQA